MRLVGGVRTLALVDEVHAQFLKNLRLGEVADAGLAMTGMETAWMICLMRPAWPCGLRRPRRGSWRARAREP